MNIALVSGLIILVLLLIMLIAGVPIGSCTGCFICVCYFTNYEP